MSPAINQFSRRNFLATGSLGLIAFNTVSAESLLAQVAEKPGPGKPLRIAKPRKWYETAYRRAVIDMHIPDWDEKFLSEFDAHQYVQMLVKSRAQSIVCYAHSHVGLFNYPTKVGQQHRGLKGRNIVQEMIEGCHARNIAVVLYTSLIHDRWAFDQHPEWRMEKHDGAQYGVGSRYGVVCPNSPYREYVRAWVEEICRAFDFEGMRFDMTFWVGVCYCSHCRRRFADEVGGEMPTTVNWLDERWMTLQRKREEWLADFAAVAAGTVRKLKPTATVEHQSSTYPLNWTFGVSAPLVKQNDFLQGDFYGDSLQGSFVRKLLEDLTPNRPFAYETSFSAELRDHTGRKSEELLEAKASAAIADSAAFVFIDAIDPIGTVNPNAHERMGRIFDRLMPFYPHLGGERVMDIAVYYSLESKFNFKGNGKSTSQADTSDAHTASAMTASRWLIANHLPFGVITKHSLAKLATCQVLILSNVNLMDEEEIAAIREWVRGGGTLYASGGTSLVNKRGQLQKDFMLADVLGVSLVKADWQDREHYIAPAVAGQKLFGDWSAKYPPFVKGYGMEVKTHPTAQVLATTTLPWPASDPTKFSSIHSNPPWEATDRPEVVLHEFGKGRAIYCSSLLETIEGLGETFIRLIRSLSNKYHYEADAPAAVEVTMFHQPERRRYLLSLVNFQKDLPNIPIEGIKLHLRLGDKRIRSIVQLPGNKLIKHQTKQRATTITIPRLETLAMFAIQVG
ncbi:MAG: beta-galactosidase [Verrucomicrobia bacterium]|nr:beta-galactosidase [Verrucomicrobiota bacterium]